MFYVYLGLWTPLETYRGVHSKLASTRVFLAPGWCESYWEVSQGSRVIPISSIVLLFPAASKQSMVTQHPFFLLSLFEERRTICHCQVLPGAPLLCLAGSHLHATASASGNPPATPFFVSLHWFASPYISHYLSCNPSLSTGSQKFLTL